MAFAFRQVLIPGPWLIEPMTHPDNRGLFLEDLPGV